MSVKMNKITDCKFVKKDQRDKNEYFSLYKCWIPERYYSDH